MLPLSKQPLNHNVGRRLTPAANAPRSLKRSECNKATQTTRFTLRSLFQETTFFLRVIREHLFPQRLSGSAPRWDIGVAFRHRKTMVALKMRCPGTNTC